MLLRRDFTKLALAATAIAVPAEAKINSVFGGVPLGAQSYSFRDRDVDGAIAGMKEIGIGYTELFSGHVEPKVERGPAGQAALPSAVNRMSHLLIVDDKEENLYYLQALLTAHGNTVELAPHGAEALVKARQNPPQLTRWPRWT